MKLAPVERDRIASSAPRLSVVIEWANTRLNGRSRADRLLQALVHQWREIVAGHHPPGLSDAARAFLDGLDPRLEILIVSGEALAPDVESRIRGHLPADFEVGIHLAEGLEYYPLKNFGAERAKGDLLLFIDSDVLPDEGFLAHLLGSFGRSEVAVVSGQTYVAPTSLFARAFALGWSYELRAEQGTLATCRKFFANAIAFRAPVFHETPFPSLGQRTRGAASVLRERLARRGIPVWGNTSAGVDHPPPSSFRHMAIRGLAHGRDLYMTLSEQRNWPGLKRSMGEAVRRLARGGRNTFVHGHRVGLRPWAIPAVLAILVGYYGLMALGGLLTHAHPAAMGRRFRI